MLRKKLFMFVFLLSLGCCGNISALPNNLTLIKGGTVAFARLDTTVQSNNTITATIIDGKYLGAKLKGKLMAYKNHDSRKLLRFTLFDFNKPHNVFAYAIDFDAARTAIVTEAEYDELKHDGAKMAASFLETYTHKSKLNLGAGTDLGILFMSDVA